MRIAFAAIALVCATLLAATAAAQPTIQVRARAFLDGLQASTRGGVVVVEGALRDNLGAPVVRVKVQIDADGETVDEVLTDTGGRFNARFALAGSGERTLRVRFAGSLLLDAAEARLPVTVGRNALRLRLDVPDEVPVGRATTVGVAAYDSRDVPVPELRLNLDLDGAPLRAARTNRSGRDEVGLPPLDPGVHTLRLHFPGDSRFTAAEATREIEVARPMAVALAPASTAPLEPGDPIVLDVTLGPEKPATVRITLTAEGRPIDDVDVIGGGTRFVVDPDDVEPGPVRFRALAHAEAVGWKDALSEVVTLDVPPPPPPSPWWIRAPAILAAVSLLGVLVRIRRRPEAAAPPPPVVDAGPPPFTFVSERQSGASDRLVVIVKDGLDARPLAATVVRLPALSPPPLPGDPTVPRGERAATDAQGQVVFDGDGGDRLWAHAPGYAPSCHPLPRAGGRAVLHLLPVRARMQTLYAEVLGAAGRPPLRFGRETPREAADALTGRGAPDGPLASLTALVEEACFGAREPDERDLIEAFELAHAVQRGLGGAA